MSIKKHPLTMQKHWGFLSFRAIVRRVSSKSMSKHNTPPLPSAVSLEFLCFSHSSIASNASRRTSWNSQCRRWATDNEGLAILFAAAEPQLWMSAPAVTDSTDSTSLVMLWRYCISPGTADEYGIPDTNSESEMTLFISSQKSSNCIPEMRVTLSKVTNRWCCHLLQTMKLTNIRYAKGITK